MQNPPNLCCIKTEKKRNRGQQKISRNLFGLFLLLLRHSDLAWSLVIHDAFYENDERPEITWTLRFVNRNQGYTTSLCPWKLAWNSKQQIVTLLTDALRDSIFLFLFSVSAETIWKDLGLDTMLSHLTRIQLPRDFAISSVWHHDVSSTII